MTREEFIQQYVLNRTSHKRLIDDLLLEADKAYEHSVKQRSQHDS